MFKFYEEEPEEEVIEEESPCVFICTRPYLPDRVIRVRNILDPYDGLHWIPAHSAVI